MRIQVNLSDEMVERVGAYAKKFGVTRSSLCSMLIGQAVMGYDEAISIINDNAKGLLKAEIKQ